MKYLATRLATAAAAIAVGAASLAPAAACTRAVYLGAEDTVITGRSMDWAEDMHTNLWVMPRGVERDGAAGPDSPKWTAKYGSVVASGYDIGTADGMNEAGLVANLLFLAESDYGSTEGKPPLSMALWAQYVLDNFATVDEAVTVLEAEPFRVQTAELPNGKTAQLHLAISDATGDSAIFEYLDGELVIHHGREYRVLTNSPTYDQQLALNTYWEEIGGLTFLPGTNRAADRFARASFLIQAIPTDVAPGYISAVPDHTFANQAAASVLSVMRSVSVPLGITTPGQPNISSTLWRTVSDQKNKVYFFDSSTSPNTFWVPLADLDFSPGAPVKKLALAGGRIFSGNAAGDFVEAEPFVFMTVDPK